MVTCSITDFRINNHEHTLFYNWKITSYIYVFEVMTLMNNLNLESKIILKRLDLMEYFRKIDIVKTKFVSKKYFF